MELGEIEYRISASSENIAAAAVDVPFLNKDSKALVAFFVPAGEANLQFTNNIGRMTAKIQDQIGRAHV